jgi:predicted nucleic acid-binding protein
MLSAVVDSTVLVSAFLSQQGAAAVLLTRGVARAFTCLLALEIIEETQRALHDPRIQERYTYTDEEIEAYGRHLLATFRLKVRPDSPEQCVPPSRPWRTRRSLSQG